MAIAGDNPERLCSEAALAALYGVGPVGGIVRKNNAAPVTSRWRSFCEQCIVDDEAASISQYGKERQRRDGTSLVS